VFNLFIAVGAAASGVVVDALGVPSVLWLGALLALLVLLTVRWAPRARQRELADAGQAATT
jgi:predicted MFS family arabinose efflux permease